MFARRINSQRPIHTVLSRVIEATQDQESACLLNPCRDLKEPGTDQDLRDGKYIVFLQDGYAISSAHFDAERIDNRPDPAGNSIALYGLNRRGLIHRRWLSISLEGRFSQGLPEMTQMQVQQTWQFFRESLFQLDVDRSFLSAFTQFVCAAVNSYKSSESGVPASLRAVEAHLGTLDPTGKWLGSAVVRDRAIVAESSAGSSNIAFASSHPRRIRRISRTGTSMLSCDGSEPDFLTYTNLLDGKLLSQFRASSEILHFSSSKDGVFIASAEANGIVRILRSSDLEPIHLLEHPSEVLSVRFSSDARKLLTVCEGNAWLLDVERSESLRTIAFDERIDDAVFIGDDSRLLLSGNSAPLRIYSIESEELLYVHPGKGSSCTPAADASGERIAAADQDALLLHNLVNPERNQHIEWPGIITSLAFCPVGEFRDLLAIGLMDGLVIISDLQGNPLWEMEHDGTLTDVDFSADGRKLHLTGRGRVVRIIDIAWLRQQRQPVDMHRSGAQPDTLERVPQQQQQQQQQQMSGPPKSTGTTETQEHIVSLKLQNFRSIPEMEIDFSPRSKPPKSERGESEWARMKVLLGENGLGKSSILWAIAIALMGREEYERLAKLPHNHLAGHQLLRYKEKEGSIKIQLSGNSPERVVSFRRSSDDEDLVNVSFNKAAERTSSTYLCAYSTARLLNEQKANEKLFDTEQALTRGIAWLRSLNHSEYAIYAHGLWTSVWKKYYLNHPDFDNASETTMGHA